MKAQKFYFLAEQSLNLIQKAMMPVLKEYQLNHSQHIILLILLYSDYSGNEIMSTELSYFLGLEKHSITSLVNSLSKRGLVKRQRSRKDRRVINLKLTGKGRELAVEIHPRTIKKIAVFPDCSEEEFNFLYSFLEKLRDLSAENNNQTPAVFRNAFTKLLLEGEKIFEEKIFRDANYKKHGFL